MLPKTWAWYKSQFPSATFYLMDNYSTDRTEAVARLLGMNIIKIGDDLPQVPFDPREGTIHNVIWRRTVKPGTWVITADMDELICLTQERLEKEDQLGSTILKSDGYDLIADSNRTDLSDLSFGDLRMGRPYYLFSKKLVFKAGLGTGLGIDHMNYGVSAHFAHPNGTRIASNYTYQLYHAGDVGLPYSIQKFEGYRQRFVATQQTVMDRNGKRRNVSTLYYDHFASTESVISRYNKLQSLAFPLRQLGKMGCVRRDDRVHDPSLDDGVKDVTQLKPGAPLPPSAVALRAKLRSILGPAASPIMYSSPPPSPPRPPHAPPKPMSAAALAKHLRRIQLMQNMSAGERRFKKYLEGQGKWHDLHLG